MKVRHIVIGKLEQLDKLLSSPDGNPMWELQVDGRVYRTKHDINDAHAISEDHLGQPVMITVEQSGFGERIVNYRPQVHHA